MLGVEFGVEVFSAGIMFIQGFMKVDHVSQILNAGHSYAHAHARLHTCVRARTHAHSHTHTQHGYLKSLLFSFLGRM
jgi:hypothetical protein